MTWRALSLVPAVKASRLPRAGTSEARGSLRTSTRPTLHPTDVCMRINPEGSRAPISVRDLKRLFSMTLLYGDPAAFLGWGEAAT
jgi:hypothetical protein